MKRGLRHIVYRLTFILVQSLNDWANVSCQADSGKMASGVPLLGTTCDGYPNRPQPQEEEGSFNYSSLGWRCYSSPNHANDVSVPERETMSLQWIISLDEKFSKSESVSNNKELYMHCSKDLSVLFSMKYCFVAQTGPSFCYNFSHMKDFIICVYSL